jgi:hypothetical protein
MSTSTTTSPAVRRDQVSDPRSKRLTELNELARTTPGVLTILAAALVLFSVLIGVLTALTVRGKAQALDDLTTRSGPLSVASQDIYRALSDADASATSAFLSGGLEPVELRERYESDIAQAEAALAVAVAAREPADVAAGPLATLSGQLSVYTGLVETARANNRLGLPVGAAYQREASYLMRTALLPAANELYQAETTQVADDQDSAGSFPVVAVLLGVVGLAVLVAAQLFLRRRTNRVFNVGMLVATGAALVSLVWVVIASLGVSANVNASREDGSAQVEVLAQARITALAARSEETLTLVARGSGAAFEEQYNATRVELGALLDDAAELATSDGVRAEIDSAAGLQQDWHAVHEQIRTADDGGDYDTAVTLAIGPDENGAAARFDQLDTDLREAIEATTATFDDEVSQASNAVTGAVVGVILLAILMAVGSAAGIWQRLKEYR